MYFFKKKIQLILKEIVYKIFKFIYGEVTYNNNFEEKHTIMEVKKDDKLYKIINIKDGRIYTDYVEHVAIISNNNIVKDFSYQQINGRLEDFSKNTVIKKGTPRLKKRFKGKVLSLVQGASGNNYFHWLFDIIPKLFIIDNKIGLKNIDHFFLPDTRKWQLSSLSILDIDKNKIINSKTNTHISADNIIATSHPWYKNGYILNEAKFLPKWIIDEVNLKFSSFAKKFDCNSYFFIDRRESPYKHCQIINDDEIKEYLKKKNFSIYKVGELSFFEQIYLFQNAKKIIGAHGAAFANLAFCKPGTQIIEIIPENHPNTVDQTISSYKMLDFNFIRTKKLGDYEKEGGDILLPIKEIEKFL